MFNSIVDKEVLYYYRKLCLKLIWKVNNLSKAPSN